MRWWLSATTTGVEMCARIPHPGSSSDRCPSSMIAKATSHFLSKTLHVPAAKLANIFNVPSRVDTITRTSFKLSATVSSCECAPHSCP